MSAALDLRSKEDKDAELDKRIEALRKKNEALIKRYQEIEEDRKKAEQEGIAVTAFRKARDSEWERRWVEKDLSVTVQVAVAPGEKRIGKDRKVSGMAKSGRGAASRGSRGSGRSSVRHYGHREYHSEALWEGGGGGDAIPAERGSRNRRSRGHGVAGMGMGGDTGSNRKSKEWEERRRQNIEKMNEEMEKIAEYERNQRDGLHEKNPVRNFLDDPRRSGPFQDSDRKEGSRRHVRNWGGTDFDRVKTGMEREKSWKGGGKSPGRHSSPKSGTPLDMTLSMTGRERAEYVRWKKERDQIDQERLARHRKPTGQWRREWDAEKSESMFKEGSPVAAGLEASGGEESKRPLPKPPTFGEFLTPHRTQRRKKGRERRQGAGTKAYSMHDNRWEEKEPPPPTEESETQKAEEASSGALSDPPASQNPEEDEDQWEDVSEDEDGSPGSLSEEEEEEEEEEEAPRSASPVSGQDAAPAPRVPPAPIQGGGSPPSPFSHLEYRRPISDWGEEMELTSPRSSVGDNPLPGPVFPKSGGASGEIPGLSPAHPEGSPPREEAIPDADPHLEAVENPAENGMQGIPPFRIGS
ncbi:coiled-coil domain-containing protein 9 isoform X2 [Cuculus canorus]|uniref:coiled-coil domain-containing protein 9 isoform X2 n=1 Tax=Cuculus canorus TaxID=55661 RepID=UPI0023AA9DAA|nr:coiled-coil domain-containing protein 9 isoform X2 [Cuculus canorus]